jgi:DNA-directed RNA polymerase specialized sigma subunit
MIKSLKGLKHPHNLNLSTYELICIQGAIKDSLKRNFKWRSNNNCRAIAVYEIDILQRIKKLLKV